MFIRVDRTAPTPAYRQIYQSIQQLIVHGALRPGAKLPSTRDLARDLGVNRITVGRAFQLLESQGFISSKVGDGTYVRPQLGRMGSPGKPLARPDEESALRVWGPLFVNPRSAPRSLPSMPPSKGRGAASFVYAAPPPDLFPADDFRKCVDYALKCRIQEVCRVGAANGLASLKEYLIGWLAQHDIAATQQTLVITTGCQQSLDLTRKLLLRPGEPMLLENPTFPGAVGALSPSGAGLMELPVQEGGPDFRAVNSLASQNRCKLIYVTPTFQNPTGLTMSTEQRLQLAELAIHHNIPIVEDDVFGHLRYDGPAPPPLQSLCPNHVIYIGSFSKMLSPSLRLGWMVAPPPVAEQVTLTKQASDLHTGTLIQAAMDEFCRRGLMIRHLKRIKRVFRSRRDAMAEAIHRWFPSEARWTVPQGGLSMWVTLPGRFDTQELLKVAQERGVQFLPGSVFHFRSVTNNSMRLSFATENEDTIAAGIKTLGELVTRRRPQLVRIGDWQDRQAIV